MDLYLRTCYNQNNKKFKAVKKMKCRIPQPKLDTIVDKLRKYPFIEKMIVCQQGAMRLMRITHMDILNTPNAVYPWELEVFAELSLFADAPAAICSFNNSDKEFIDMINVIRNYQHPFLKQQKDENFANAFIMATCLQQFKHQENIYDRLYRYNYFWNFVNDEIDMPKIFEQHFGGIAYSDFRDLGILIYFYASLKETTTTIFQAIGLKYIKAVNALKITREDYKQRQSEKIDDNYENAIFGFNYLRPYPFVEFNENIFIPLPFLIIDAVTDSLLTRITINDNFLREKIGKEVAQSYIQKIYEESHVYDEVLPESAYYIGKRKLDSPDVLIRKDTQVCFIDTKLSTPRLEIRKFNTQVIEETVTRCAKNIIQMYNRVKDFNKGCYYPFEEKTHMDKKDVFGIVALLEDPYVSKRQIYAEVFSQLKIEATSEEANYIKSNIKITNFRDLELFAFRSHNIFVALTEKRDNPKDWNDMGLFNELLYKSDVYTLLPSIGNFIDMGRSVVLRSADEFEKLGIIKKC